LLAILAQEGNNIFNNPRPLETIKLLETLLPLNSLLLSIYFSAKNAPVTHAEIISLKGQSHEKFCEMGVWGLSLGQN
jgi:hypothetical protein